MSKTFSIKTLGCKLNQYESSSIAHHFLSRGWSPVDFGVTADAVIINTCTVTDRSDKKCRNLIRQGARSATSGKVIVTGCMADARRDELLAMSEVAAAFTNSGKSSIVGYAEEMLEPGATISESSGQGVDAPLPYLHTRGFLKIQDGCDNSCTYCIVPSVRGRASSRTFDVVVDHARKLIDAGCPELVLTGITIGGYNSGGRTLADIVKAITDLEGRFRVRITSIEPDHVTPGLAEMFSHPRVCPHIHLPLQSGSDRILSLMNRHYDRSKYMESVARLRKIQPDLAVGADLIIGFPGESDDDFADSLSMVREAEFAYVHQFTFSPRAGTPAASMAQTVRPDEIALRAKRLRETSLDYALRYRRRFVGQILESVVEKNRGNDGYTAVSGNYIKISLEDSAEARRYRGKLAPVMLDSSDPEESRGHVMEG